MILIDRDMPKKCGECFARQGCFCFATKNEARLISKILDKATQINKPEWCPLHKLYRCGIWELGDFYNGEVYILDDTE